MPYHYLVVLGALTYGILTLIVIPAPYALVNEYGIKRGRQASRRPACNARGLPTTVNRT